MLMNCNEVRSFINRAGEKNPGIRVTEKFGTLSHVQFSVSISPLHHLGSIIHRIALFGKIATPSASSASEIFKWLNIAAYTKISRIFKLGPQS